MLRTIVVLCIVTWGVAAGLFSRFAALLLYVWFAFFRPQEWLWVDITSYRPSLLLGLFVAVPSIATGVLPNLTHPLSVGILAFLVSALMSQTNAIRPDISWQWVAYFARLSVILLLAVSLVNSQRRLFWLIAVSVMSLAFHSARTGIASVLGDSVRVTSGQAGAFIDNNGYALAIAMVIPLLIASARNVPQGVPFRRAFVIALWFAVPLSALTLVSTFSRSGFLALAAAVLVWIVLQERRVVLLAVVALLIVCAVPFIPAGYFDRVATIQTYDEIEDQSALSRLHFWRVALDMVADHPMGIGLKNFEQRYDEYDFLDGQFGTRRAVHSSHLEVLAENGFLGLAVWVGLFAYSVRICRRIRRSCLAGRFPSGAALWYRTYADALLASMAAFVVGGAFIALSLNDLTWFTFVFVAALDRVSRQELLAAAPRRDEESQAELAAPAEVRGRLAVG